MKLRGRLKRWLYGSKGSCHYFGTRVFFPTRSHIFAKLCESGIYERDNLKLLAALVRPETVYFDVGANIGWTVLNLANIAKYGKVFGFEPDPFNFDRCQENLLQNNKFNCEVFPLGLGAKTGSVSMEVRTPSNRGGNRIAVSHTANNREVKIVCLDEFEPIHKLSAIDLIKMDVEGYELNVLQGAKTLLQKHKPILFIELDDNNLRDQGASALALVLFLFEVGYKKIEHAEDSSKINATTDFAHCHFDIIAR